MPKHLDSGPAGRRKIVINLSTTTTTAAAADAVVNQCLSSRLTSRRSFGRLRLWRIVFIVRPP